MKAQWYLWTNGDSKLDVDPPAVGLGPSSGPSHAGRVWSSNGEIASLLVLILGVSG